MKPKFNRLLAASITSVLALSLPAFAATLYWDGTTSTVNNQSDNTNTAAQNWFGDGLWDNGTTSATLATWTAGDSAVFGGSAASQTITAGTLTIGNMTFGSGATGTGTTATAYTITGGAITLSATSTVTVAQNSTTTIATNLSGGGVLKKLGAGKLTLSGTNSYTGGTLIQGGTLSIGAISAINNSTGYLAVQSGATLEYTGSGSETRSGTLWFDTGAANINVTNSTASLTLWRTGGNFNQALTKTGIGTLRFGANGDNSGASANVNGGVLEAISSTGNNFASVTVNNGGTFRIGTLDGTGAANGADRQIWNGGVLTVNTGGTFDQNGKNETVGRLDLFGGSIIGAGTLTSVSTIAAQGGSSATILAGGNGLTKTTGGTLVLTGANSYTGTTTISAGTLQLGDGTNGKDGTLASASVVNNSNLTFNRFGSASFSGAISGTGSVTMTGAGSQTLTGNTSYTGSTTINSGAQLILSNAGNQSLSGTLLGAGSLTKQGAGTLTLSGGGSYSGAITLSDGGLTVNGSLASVSSFSIAAGKTLGVGNSGLLTTGSMTFDGAGIINFGAIGNYASNPAINVTGTLTLNGGAGAVTLNLASGIVSGGTYHLIGTSLGSLSGFTLGTTPTLSSRQTGALTLNTGFVDYVVSGVNPSWTGALSSEWSTATLAAPKNWILPGGGGTTDFIAGDIVTFDDSATGTTAVDIAANVSPTTVAFSNVTKDYTLTGAAGITGSATLTKSSAGTVTINNANSYTGATAISAGTIIVGNAGAFGTSTVGLNGGTIDIGSNTVANAFTLGGGAITANGGTLSGVISGSGALIKNGVGTLTLSNTNNYTGGTTLNAGTLAVNSATSLGNTSGALTFAGNSTLQTLATFSTARNFVLNTGITGTIDTNGFNLTQSGTITGAGALTKAGAGTLQLSANNTFSGNVLVSGGELQTSGSNNTTALGSNAVGRTITINSGATLKFMANDTFGNASSNPNPSLIINGTVTNATTAFTTLGAVTLNSGSLVSTGGAQGGYQGYSFSSSVTATGTSTMSSSGTNSNFHLGSNTTVDVTGASDLLTVSGVLMNRNSDFGGGAGGLTKTGAGTLTLSSANIFTGTTTISGGVLKLNNANAVQSSTVSVGLANGLQFGTGIGTFNIGSLTGSGDVLLADTGAIAVTLSIGANNASPSAYTGVLSGAGSVTKVGTGILALSATNTFSGGLLINAGAVTTNNNNGLGGFGGPVPSITLGSGASAATLTLTSTGVTALRGNITVAAGAGDRFFTSSSTGATATSSSVSSITLNKDLKVAVTGGAAGSLTIAGVISGAGGLIADSTNVGTMILSNANTYNGATTISGGTLQIGNGGTTGSIASTSGVTNNATLAYNRSDALTVGYAIGGTGAVKQIGAGTTTLTNTNGYTGVTTITAGTLQLGDGTTGKDGTIAGASIVNNANLTYNRFATSGLNYSGVISGSGSVTKTGAGTQTLSGANTYTGTTTIDNGTLIVQGTPSWQTNGSRVGNNVVVNNGGTLKSGDHHQFGWTGTLANITVNSGGTFDQNGKDAYIGTLTLNGNASLTNGAATNQYLGLSGGAVTYTGTGSQQTTVATGLKLRDTGGGAVNATFTVNGTNTAGDLVVSGAIQDGGSLTKAGTGTLVLSGANTYIGGTNVDAGKLVINGSTSATGAVAVGASGTLAGTGTVGGATTISGTHAVGSAAGSVGNQTFSNGVTYADGSIFSWDLNANAHGTKGSTYDGVLGAATANTGSIFNVVFGDDVNLGHEFWSTLHTTQTWAMTDIFTSFTGSFTTVTSTANAATQGAFTITGGGSTLTWTAVPEPTSALAGLLLAAGLLRRNRRAGFTQSQGR